HNDDRLIAEDDASRWNALGVELKPWREEGKHVLVCPNRSFGTPGRFMPWAWAEDVAARLRQLTNRPIRIRPHPGNSAPAKPLAEDLADAWCTVIWTSSAGVHSLIAGVPVISEAPAWICRKAAYLGYETFRARDEPRTEESGAFWDSNRLAAMHRLAWANWSLAEIQSGEALDRVLCAAREGEVRAAD